MTAPALQSRAPATHSGEFAPGFVEKFTTGLVFFFIAYRTPDRWFVGAATNNPSADTTRLVIFLLVCGLLLRVAFHGELWKRVLLLDLRLQAFVFLILLSVLWSADPAATVRLGGELAIATLFAMYVVMRYRLREWLNIVAWSAGIGAILNITFAVALPVYGVELGDWTGLLQNKNLLALQALYDIILLVAAASANPRRRHLFWMFAFLALVTLAFSNGKTALVALVLTVGTLPFYAGFRGRKSFPGAVGCAFVAIAVAVLGFATANLGLITNLLGKDITLTGRTLLWELLVDVVWQRPIFGHGFGGTFGGYFSPVHEVWAAVTWEPGHAHNSLYQILLDLGLVGVVLFVWLFAVGVKRAIRFTQVVPGALGLFPLAVFTASFAISLAETGVVLSQSRWLYFALTLLTVGITARREPDETDTRASTREAIPATPR